MDKKDIARFAALSIFLIVLSAALACAAVFWGKNLKPAPPVEEKSEAPLSIFGVMIENELLARPFQKGLTSAHVVYEAPTEGNITRFLAIFNGENLPEKIGPIRSARTYFLDWMHEYGGIYVHVGGHFDALKRLAAEKNSPIIDADQFYNEQYFWRENVGKTALEHTMFTSREKLFAFAAEKNIAQAQTNTPALLKQNKNYLGQSGGGAVNKISINFGRPPYVIDWEYDKAKAEYLRYQAKKPHIDTANNEQVAAGAVIVQKVRSWSNGDLTGTISIKTIGEGDVFVFQDGRAAEAKWKKEALDLPTRFFNKKTDAEIFIKSGSVWIEVLPQENVLEFDKIR